MNGYLKCAMWVQEIAHSFSKKCVSRYVEGKSSITVREISIAQLSVDKTIVNSDTYYKLLQF